MAIYKLNDYKKIVGDDVIKKIRESAKPLKGREILNINTVSFGGGVAEILNNMIILLDDVGINAEWSLMKASPDFFFVTKEFHNGLQGSSIDLTKDKKAVYLEYNERNSLMNITNDQDLIVVHDPQPLALIKFSERKQPWVWRCHIDITNPNKGLWDFVSPLIKQYDAWIVSAEKYNKKDLNMKTFIIPPSIDPLAKKNRELSEAEIKKLLSEWGIGTEKPIITQVSRFDKWKDPMGVIDTYKMVKKEVDCKLLLVGNMAADDPEGNMMLNMIREKCKGEQDIQIVTNAGDELVNAVQRISSAVFQKSIREGFGLTVAEALWKGTPVIGTPNGGIPLQVLDGKTGYVVNNVEEAAKRCVQLLKDDKLREDMGKAAKEHVRKNFLITRHMQDYIDLFNEMMPANWDKL